MIGSLRNLWDNFRGSGAMALTVPPMDGAFRPNTAIETAQVVTKGDHRTMSSSREEAHSIRMARE